MFARTVLIVAVLCAAFGSVMFAPRSTAQTFDAFFDIWVDAVERGEVWRELDAATPIIFTDIHGVSTEMSGLSMRQSGPLAITDLGGGHYVVDSFFDIEYRLAPPGSPDFTVDSFFDVEYRIEFQYDPARSSADQATFDIDLLSMDLAGATPSPTNISQLRRRPDSGPKDDIVVVRELDSSSTKLLAEAADLTSPTHQIDSFFDIEFELSMDAGASWTLGSSNALLSESVQTVPEPTIAAVSLLCIALLSHRRQRFSSKAHD